MYAVRRSRSAFVCKQCMTCMRDGRNSNGRHFATTATLRSLFDEMDALPSREEGGKGTRRGRGSSRGGGGGGGNHGFTEEGVGSRKPSGSKRFGNKREFDKKRSHFQDLRDKNLSRSRFSALEQFEEGRHQRGYNDRRNLSASGSSSYGGRNQLRHTVTRQLQSLEENLRAADNDTPSKALNNKSMRLKSAVRAAFLIQQAGNFFDQSPLRKVVVDAMRKAYPNIERMTNTQREMITLLKENFSLCVRGLPGSGKSFAIALYLLGAQRAVKSTLDNREGSKTPTITALVIVPTPDLCIQYANWFSELLAEFPGQKVKGKDVTPPPNDKIFQVLYRSNEEVEAKQEATLREHPNPHILVTTPKRLLDLLDDRSFDTSLDLKHVNKVVVDEVDLLIAQLKHGVTSEEIEKIKYIKKSHRGGKVLDSPTGKILDFIFASQPYSRRSLGLPGSHQIQLVLVSATANTRLRAVALFQRDWLIKYQDVEGVRTISQRPENNMPVIGIRNSGTHETIIQNSIPANLSHHVVLFDRETGILRDAPLPTLSEEDVIAESFMFKITEVEKAEQRLRAMNDSRFDVLNKEEAAKSVKEELEQVTIEIGDSFSDRKEKAMAAYYRAGIGREVVSGLLTHDNFPADVIVYLHPYVSKVHFMKELLEDGYDVRELTLANLAEREQERKEEAQSEKSDAGVGERGKSDTVLWVSDANSCRGMDTQGIYHAYVMYPWTRPYQYIHMCGRIARNPWPRHHLAPKGRVTSVVLSEDIPFGELEETEEAEADITPGVILQGHESEEAKLRQIALRLGRVKAQPTPYFGRDGGSAPVTEPLPLEEEDEEGYGEEFERYEDERETTMPLKEYAKVAAGDEYVEITAEDKADESVPKEPENAEDSSSTTTQEETSNEEDVIHARSEHKEDADMINSKAPPASHDNTPHEIHNVVTLEEELALSGKDTDSGPIVLQDGPHFAGEDSTEPEEAHTIPTTPPVNPAEGIEDEFAHLLNKELEIGEGVTKEDAEEFQKAQDEVFASFLELQKLMDDVKKKREEMEQQQQQDGGEKEEGEAVKDDEKK